MTGPQIKENIYTKGHLVVGFALLLKSTALCRTNIQRSGPLTLLAAEFMWPGFPWIHSIIPMAGLIPYHKPFQCLSQLSWYRDKITCPWPVTLNVYSNMTEWCLESCFLFLFFTPVTKLTCLQPAEPLQLWPHVKAGALCHKWSHLHASKERLPRQCRRLDIITALTTLSSIRFHPFIAKGSN